MHGAKGEIVRIVSSQAFSSLHFRALFPNLAQWFKIRKFSPILSQWAECGLMLEFDNCDKIRDRFWSLNHCGKMRTNSGF